VSQNDSLPPESAPPTLSDLEIPVELGSLSDLPDPFPADELPPESEPSGEAAVFASIVGHEIDKRFSRLTGAIGEILAFAQDLREFKDTQESHGRRISENERDIAELKRWRKNMERAAE
jgi:hypothetical protein